MPTTTADVRDFLSQRRLAMVGVSRNPKEFSRMLFREMCTRGYDMIPVNPAIANVDDRVCFGSVKSVQPAPDAALIMTSSSETMKVVHDCAAAGIKRVWMYRAGGQGAVNQDAIAFCRENGITVVEGHCPFMFLPGTPLVHRIHGFVLKIFGAYPKEAPSVSRAA
jgi:uncharacterized protein